jgi:hypothetical protein
MTISDALVLGGIVVGWILVNRYLLPKLGVAT